LPTGSASALPQNFPGFWEGGARVIMSRFSETQHHDLHHEKPNFIVRILTCRNAGWQGELRWLNGKKKVYFRSLNELVGLIQEAVEKSGPADPEQEQKLRSWSEDSVEDVSRF